ncbi:unnamed protein product [Sphagnum tenellum]
MALKEEQLEGRGRGMVAARALRGGEELLCETPLLVYQDEEAANTNTFCSHYDNVHDLHDFLIEALHGSDVDPLGFSVDLTGALLAKDACNAFGLMAPSCESGERKMRGYAIYNRSSLFNHDCLPNACRFEYIDKPGNSNLDVHIRALHDIEEGTEICISYFPINWTFGDRQRSWRKSMDFNAPWNAIIVAILRTEEEFLHDLEEHKLLDDD